MIGLHGRRTAKGTDKIADIFLKTADYIFDVRTVGVLVKDSKIFVCVIKTEMNILPIPVVI